MSDEQVSWGDVLDLVTRLDESGLADAEIAIPGVQVRVSRTALPTTTESAAPAPSPSAAVAPATEAAAPAPVPDAAPAGAGSSDGLVEITAPMLGVVYLRPSPDAPPFVQVGDAVEPDTTVAIVEVMKLMNNVPAGVSGRIVEVAATEGEMAEHGAVLYRVDPA